MQVMIGGIIAAVIGLIGLIIWWKPFLIILAGGVPIALLLGGALAIYVGYDELRDQMREKKESRDQAEELEKTKAELEKAKAESEKLKEELEKTKTE
ncbi:MAG: hypothetical protein M0P57_01680 [Syntrophales bacterium]|jgi:uncharacterized protein (DUF3084 family)|nr:hypothetical protein [Syntrophales bacterium]MDY0043393.1 hypothetical protein [Syntrophales bacterium]